MATSYHLQDIQAEGRKNPRHFMVPTADEIAALRVGEQVRLFFVFNFETPDNCRAERMWVEISERNSTHFKGYLTNQPQYIKDLQIGDLVEFEAHNIATVIIKSTFDSKLFAIITKRALEQKAVNWLVLGEPDNPQDSGWQLFYGDEDETYLDNVDNATIISLEGALTFEPRLEKAFTSGLNAFEWDEDENDFVAVEGY